MTAADSFPRLAALAGAPHAHRDELTRECRKALSTIDRLEASSCTPAERALIDAALAVRGAHDAGTRPCWFCGIRLLDAADAVLAERGEA